MASRGDWPTLWGVVWRTWQQAWQDSLYADGGFYRQPAGPAAHFATSAQGIPGSAPLLASAVVALARRHACDSILEIAAGRGELLVEVARAAPDLHLHGVDVSPRPAVLPESAEWTRADGGAGLPPTLHGLQNTLVFAHEWLDVVPCPVVQFDANVWRIVEVADSGEERLGDPVDHANLQWLQNHWPGPPQQGGRAEIGSTRDAAYATLRERLSNGVLVVVDYGHLAQDRPTHGSLMGFRDGAACSPLPDGSTDITAHVAIDSLAGPEVRRLQQREIFAELGITRPTPETTLAATDPPAYLHALVERSALATLTAAGGLGDFWWLVEEAPSR